MSDKPMDRRQFLKFTSAGVLSSVVFNKWNPLFADVKSSGRDVSFLTRNFRQGIPTFCNLCPAQCGIIGFIDRKNWLAGIAGNPEHPNSRGKICARGIAGMNLVHDPERLLYPLKRKGKRGEGKWEKISWEDALKEIAGRLKNTNFGKVAVNAEERIYTGLTRRFFGKLDNSIYIRSPLFSDVNKIQAQRLTWGADFEMPDLENSEYILVFGINPFESHPYFVSISERIVKARMENGAKLITFDPRLSHTAGRSDLWIPVKPGTDGFVALAMANVILQKNLADLNFIANWTNVTVSELRSHLQQFTAERAAKISGVEKSLLEKIATEFATRKGAVAISGSGITKRAHGMENERAVMLLNAIIGNIDEKGGYGLPQKLDLSEFGNWVEEAESADFYDKIESGEEKINIHFSVLSNPAFETPESDRISSILANEKLVPFAVVVDHVMSETAMLADLVLPVATHLESWNISIAPTFERKKQITLSQPVIEPVGESKEIWQIWIDLAKNLGGSFAGDFAYKSPEQYAMEKISELASESSFRLINYLKENGSFVNKTFADFQSYRSGGFRTSSRKFQIKITGQQNISPLPSPAEPDELKKGELVLIPYTENVITADLANAKWLSEISHDSKAFINPTTGRKLGLRDGEEAEIESAVGKFKIKIHFYQGIHPDALAIRNGGGHTAYGRVAQAEKFKSDDPDTNLLWWHEQGNGENPNRLIRLKVDENTGALASKDTVVKVKRV